MPIVSGRYANVTVDERRCELCELDDHYNQIGDEFHYLFKFPVYEKILLYITKYVQLCHQQRDD